MGDILEPEEASRRLALARYAVLDTPPDRAFDDLAELARTLTGAAASGIGFLDGDRIWFKSALGFVASRCDRGEFPTGPAADRHPVTSTTPVTSTSPVTSTTPVTLGGRTFPFWAAAPVVTGEGHRVGSLFVLDTEPRELTGRERGTLVVLARQVVAALELRHTLQSYQAVVDGVGHVVFQADERHHLVSVTPTWSRMTGLGVARSVGRPLAEFVHPDDLETLRTGLRVQGTAHEAAPFECRLRRLWGGDVPVEVISRPLIDESGRCRGTVGVIADITERKAREVEARHSQKLEALGRLSAGLAHEINTPIQFVGDNTRFLADAYRALSELIVTYRTVLAEQTVLAEHGGPGLPARFRQMILRAEDEAEIDYMAEEIPAAIQQSLDGLAQVATLVRALRMFGHPGQDRQAAVNLNEALAAAVTVVRNQVGEVADIVCDLGPLPAVTCSIGDLNQVFLHLLVNAADAITQTGERGTIRISTHLDGDHAVVTFRDTGAGMSEELQLRIFEPFFTTKEVGNGTGQGLALARAVVHDKHGGHIAVSSAVGRGSTFTLALPVGGRAVDGPDRQVGPAGPG